MNKTLFFLITRLNTGRRLPPSVRLMRLVTIAGMTVAVAVLVVSLSVASGFQSAYQRALLDFNAHAVVLFGGHPADGYRTVVDQLRPRVTGITPFLYREGLFIAGGQMRGAVVKGIDPESFRAVSRMRLDFFPEKTWKEKEGVVLGKALAEHLGLKPAGEQSVVLMVPDEHAPGATHHRFVTLAVTGTFSSGLYDYDSQYALMDLSAARQLFHVAEGEITGLEISLPDPQHADAFVASIRDLLPSDAQGLSWTELNHDLLAAVRLEKLVFTFIMGILVMVASLNMIGLVVLMVRYRLPTAALLTVLGLSARARLVLLSWGGIRAGMIGTFLGMGLGLATLVLLGRFPIVTLDPEIYFLDRLPIDISVFLCGIIATFCLGCSVVASLFGAKQSARIPVGEHVSA